MSTSRSIKINFECASREVDVSTPATLAGLQAAVASTFKVQLAARSEAARGADTDLSFTYMDSDGDDIVFDKDSELSLALRLCPSPLEISAASKQKDMKDADQPEEAKRLYKRAARNLREYHGVPSMTPPMLLQTLAFLKLHPRRLVKQGLAPKQLLAGVKAPQPLGSDSNDDLAEAVRSGMEVMSVEDDRKEWNDGFKNVGACEEPNTDADAMADADIKPNPDGNAAAAGAEKSSSSEEEEEEEEGGGGSGCTRLGKKKGAPKHVDMMHKAFVSAGIELRPREVIPLLLALGVSPRRLVKHGRVDGNELKKAMLESGKHRHPHHHHRHHRVGSRGLGHPRARGGGPGRPVGCMGGEGGGRRGDGTGGRGARGPGGKPCGPGGKPCGPGRRSVGGSPPRRDMFFFPPPPPPPRDDAARSGGGPGGFCGPHRYGRPGHPGRYGGSGGGSPFSAETMAWMEGRGSLPADVRQGGGDGRGGNGRHWYGYWG